MYPLIKRIFFLFDPEKIHYFTFSFLRSWLKIPGVRAAWRKLYSISDKRLETTVAGITFPNPVGIAAGFDKNALLINELADCGFGFVEIGTVTPVGQPGNDKPRLFRLVEDAAIINRMGFNNDGAEIVAGRLKSLKKRCIVGGNIGKNKVTPNEEAVSDYVNSYNLLEPYVDYFVVNVSSPNTPNLRELQDKGPLLEILNSLQDRKKALNSIKPIFLKIAPDLTNEQLNDIVEIIGESGAAGVIATNTTISREGLTTSAEKITEIGAGGLSGKPLTNRSTEVIKYLHAKSGGAFPIIGVGGIHSAKDALEKLEAGAALVQLYTGFIYEGPALVKRINKAILAKKTAKS